SEAFELFSGLMSRFNTEVTRRMSYEQFPPEAVEPEIPEEILAAMRAAQQPSPEPEGELVGAAEVSPADAPAPADPRAGAPLRRAPVALDPNDPSTWGKVGRNDACPCGSGKKYKHCHGKV
ncbi:MAG: SEC-C metal-binding domain-containing protein, partial [Pseudomonadota bacterium]